MPHFRPRKGHPGTPTPRRALPCTYTSGNFHGFSCSLNFVAIQLYCHSWSHNLTELIGFLAVFTFGFSTNINGFKSLFDITDINF